MVIPALLMTLSQAGLALAAIVEFIAADRAGCSEACATTLPADVDALRRSTPRPNLTRPVAAVAPHRRLPVTVVTLTGV